MCYLLSNKKNTMSDNYTTQHQSIDNTTCDESIKNLNDNCYAYATNKYGYGNLQPGGINNDTNNTFRDGLIANVTKDGHRHIDCNTECNVDEYKIMAFIEKGIDFHFYREIKKNLWSHKFTSYPPSTLDGMGNPIHDPIYSLRSISIWRRYNTFSGCFCVKK